MQSINREKGKKGNNNTFQACVVWKGLCFFFFINARMRTNHDHKRRFDRLDLHPFVRSFGRHLVCRDKTIKLNFQIEKYCMAVKANVFPKRPSNRVMRKKTTTSCYIIYYDNSHIVKYVIIVKREGKKMVSSEWVNKLIRNIKNIRSKSAVEKWNIWIKQLDFNLWKIKFALNKRFFLLQRNNKVKKRWIPIKYGISYYIVAKALSLSSCNFQKQKIPALCAWLGDFWNYGKCFFFHLVHLYKAASLI